MAQKLCLTTSIGERGIAHTEYEVRVMLTRVDYNTWRLTGVICGTSSSNFGFRRFMEQRQIKAVGGSVKDAKAKAIRQVREIAATFLELPVERLADLRSPVWIDDSD